MNNLMKVLELIETPICLIKDRKIVFINNKFKDLFNLDTILNDSLDYIKSLVGDFDIGYFENVVVSNKSYNKLVLPIEDNSTKIVVFIKNNNLDFINDINMFQLLIDSIPEIIFYKDNDLKYTIANKKCKDFYKERGVDYIIGKTDSEFLFDKEFADTCNRSDKKVIETRETIYIDEKVPIPGTDKYSIYQTIKTPIIDKYGNIYGLIGSARDNTKQKKLEEKLKTLSYKDSLTGLYNRTYFYEKIEEIVSEENFNIGVVVGDLNGLKVVNDAFGHAKGDIYISTVAKILKDACKEQDAYVFRWGGDEFITLLINATETDCKNYISKVDDLCKNIKGSQFNIAISQGYSIFNNENNDIDDVIKKADKILYRNKEFNKTEGSRQMLEKIKNDLSDKGIETSEHIDNIVSYCIKMGECMNLRYDEIQKIRLLALMHDIGKSGIDEKILLKSERLTEEEYNIAKTHVEIGHKIASMTPQISHIANEILSHHEKWDGSGYPRGLKGEEIPILSRILSVVHSYDIMVSGCIYKDKISKEEAIEVLKNNSGTQFDPNIVDIFLNCCIEDT